MENRLTKHFTLINRIAELPVLAGKTEQLAQEWGLSAAFTMNLNLVLEEALSNIIFYAFSDSREHKIRVTLSQTGNKLTVRISDDGIPFDPSSRPQPDITLPAEDRPVGGLGIFLISKLMDSVHYSRENNMNILTLTKEI